MEAAERARREAVGARPGERRPARPAPCSRSRSRPATTVASSARSPTQDIVDAIRDARGIRIDKRKVHLDEPIKTVGTHMVVVEVADGVMATVKTMVVEQK